MAKSTCIVDTCNRSRFQEGHCSAHLKEMRAARGDLCSADDCPNPRWAAGLCSRCWNQRWRADHPERARELRNAQMARWRSRNPEAALEKWRKDRARRRALEQGVDTENFTHNQVYERDGWRCGICGRKVNAERSYPHPMSASLDHVVPLSAGGSHVLANVRCTHLRCNIMRGARGGGEQLLLLSH